MTAITQLPNMASPQTDDLFATVDVHDTSEAPTGTTKKMSFATYQTFQRSLVMTPFVIKTNAPTATASSSKIFNGLGATWQITPLSSGIVSVTNVGQVLTNTNPAIISWGARYGQIAGPATTVAAGSNGGTISGIATWGSGFGGNGTLDVASTTGWATTGTIWVAASGSTVAQVSYTGVTGTAFTGCTYVQGSASGTVATGGAVTGYPQYGAVVATAVGTAWGNNGDYQTQNALAGATGADPYAFEDLLTLTPNQLYWFDLLIATGTPADTAQFKNLLFRAIETS